MAKAPLTPQQQRQQSTKTLFGNLQYGLDHGGPMGAMMAFMDLPYQTRPGATHGNIGGPWTTMWPGGVDPNAGGGGAGGKPPTTGGDGPSVDPKDPNAPMLKAGLPPWYIDWLHTSGQYGVWNKPPGGGLLD